MKFSVDDFLKKENLNQAPDGGFDVDKFLSGELSVPEEKSYLHRSLEPLADIGNRALDTVPDFAIGLAQGATNLANVIPAIARFATDDATGDFGRGVYSAAKTTSDALNLFNEELQKNKSDYSKVQAQNKIIGRDAEGDIEFNLPNASQISDLVAQSLAPGGVISKLGGGVTGVLGRAGLGKGASAIGGFGGANAAVVAPQAYDQAYTETYEYNIKQGKTPEEADKLARNAASTVLEVMLPFSVATGGAGGALASKTQGGAVQRFIKGLLIGATPEAAEEGGQQVIQDIASDRPVDWTSAANQAALGAIGGTQEGIIGVMHGSDPAAQAVIDDENAPTERGSLEGFLRGDNTSDSDDGGDGGDGSGGAGGNSEVLSQAKERCQKFG